MCLFSERKRKGSYIAFRDAGWCASPVNIDDSATFWKDF